MHCICYVFHHTQFHFPIDYFVATCGLETNGMRKHIFHRIIIIRLFTRPIQFFTQCEHFGEKNWGDSLPKPPFPKTTEIHPFRIRSALVFHSVCYSFSIDLLKFPTIHPFYSQFVLQRAKMRRHYDEVLKSFASIPLKKKKVQYDYNILICFVYLYMFFTSD